MDWEWEDKEIAHEACSCNMPIVSRFQYPPETMKGKIQCWKCKEIFQLEPAPYFYDTEEGRVLSFYIPPGWLKTSHPKIVSLEKLSLARLKLSADEARATQLKLREAFQKKYSVSGEEWSFVEEILTEARQNNIPNMTIMEETFPGWSEKKRQDAIDAY